MKYLLLYICICAVVGHVTSNYNVTMDAASRQLLDFLDEYPLPIGVFTKLSGEPLDIRDVWTMNQDLFIHRNHFRLTGHNTRERIPERVYHAKGTGAFGYFEVTNDVSKYIKSDVFNVVGKRTPVFVRFSTAIQNLGGNELMREARGMAIKMYTKHGNLDFVTMNYPIFGLKDPILFQRYLHAFKRNPRTDIVDNTARWDFMNMQPDVLHMFLWMHSDLGLPDGYRKMHAYAEHVYGIFNTEGKLSFVKFNFKSEQGLHNLTDAQARAILAEDAEYFTRDLYNAIDAKNYPSWKVDIDIMSYDDLMSVNFDPFDVTRLWKRGTYHTETIGRIVLNRHVDNHFAAVDQGAFSPDNLVPGILGPFDVGFRARKIFYPDAQNYRLGVNFDNIRVNRPLFDRYYNRDGRPPAMRNMRSAPNYIPNSWNGPMSFVDEKRPTFTYEIYHRNAVDLQPISEFYNEIIENDAHRHRINHRIANTLKSVPKDVESKAIHILTLIDKDLGHGVYAELQRVRHENDNYRRAQIAQCITEVNENLLNQNRKHHY